MLRVFVGFNDHCKNQNTKWEKGLKVKRIISRPDFPGINYTNDIALLKLKKSLRFSIKMKPACLPTDQNNMFAHKTGMVTGWGQTYTKDSCQLRVLKQTILESVVDPRCIIDKKRLCGPQRVYACIG
jgi:hypothetical protein